MPKKILTLFSHPSEEEILQNRVNEFEAKNPDIQVSYTLISRPEYKEKTLMGIEAGIIDAFSVDTFDIDRLAYWKQVMPLDGFIEESYGEITADIFWKVVKAFSFRDNIYAIPRSFNCLGLFYNKEPFQKLGIQPSNEWTWRDVEQAATKLVKVENVYGMMFIDDFIGFLSLATANRTSIFDEFEMRSDIGSERAIDALTFYRGLFKKGLLISSSQWNGARASEVFMSGKLAMAVEGSWLVPHISQVGYPVTYSAVRLPLLNIFTTASHGNLLFASGYSISSQCKNPSETWGLIKFLTDKRAQEMSLNFGLGLPYWGNPKDYPPFKNYPFLVDEVFYDKINDKITVTEARRYSLGPIGSEYADLLKKAISQTLQGVMTPEEALQGVQEQINKLLEKYK